LRLAPDAQKIATPDSSDLLLRVAVLDQFSGYVRRVLFAIETVNARAVIEIAADADVIDADAFGDVIELIDKFSDVGARLRRCDRR
jgi:hypothetical protein